MIRYIAQKNDDGKPVERLLLSRYKIERNGFYKALRKRDVKINGKRISENTVVREGDIIEAYIPFKQDAEKGYKILYQNEYLLIVDKKQGIPVTEDRNHEFSLLDRLSRDFGQEFTLCHRIDRNTGGIVVLSKRKEYADTIKNALNTRCCEKIYHCLVSGNAASLVGIQKAWHFKDRAKNRVYIYAAPRKYAKEILTEIKSVEYDSQSNTSVLEISLITGRTHQIRAHLAFLGFPILGDGKYGSNAVNEKYGYRYQALWACALIPRRMDAQLARIFPDRAITTIPAYE